MDWHKYNRASDIPQQVVRKARQFTRRKLVIDFGSGIDTGNHIDFQAKRTLRLDKVAVGDAHVPFSGLDEAISGMATDQSVVIVFFRVLSILSPEDHLKIVDSLRRLRDRIDHVIVYDYTTDERKTAEYEVQESWNGRLHKPKVEWSNDVFFHLSRENVLHLIPLTLVHESLVPIPAHKRADGRGLFMVFTGARDLHGNLITVNG